PRREAPVVGCVGASAARDERLYDRLVPVLHGEVQGRLAGAEVAQAGVRPGTQELLDALQPSRRDSEAEGRTAVLVLLVEQAGLDAAPQRLQVMPRGPAPAVLEPLLQRWASLRHSKALLRR